MTMKETDVLIEVTETIRMVIEDGSLSGVTDAQNVILHMIIGGQRHPD